MVKIRGAFQHHNKVTGTPVEGSSWQVLLSFRYHEGLKDAIKAIPGAKWDRAKKGWVVPRDALFIVEDACNEFGWQFDCDVSGDDYTLAEPLELPSELSEMIFDYQRAHAEIAINRRCHLHGNEMGLGKAAPVSEPVLTPHGWSTMGQLRPGDQVIGRDGRATEVVGVFPQGRRQIYRVTFNDSSWCYCDSEHLWAVQTHNDKIRNPDRWRVHSAAELLSLGLRGNGKYRNLKFWIPMVAPVQFEAAAPLPMDPYTLGVYLGDGSWHAGYPSLSTDEWIAKQLRLAYKEEPGCVRAYLGSASAVLTELGLAGCRAWEKKIPEQYLRASIADRLALLQGLLDTDAYAPPGGGATYSTTSRALVSGVRDLVGSLGGIARVSKARRTAYTHNGEKRRGRPSWRVNIKLPPQFDAFRLPRKLSAWVRPTKYPPARAIKSIEYSHDEEAVCISVAAEDSLYVTRNYAVTHNTLEMIAAVCHLKPARVLVVSPAIVRRKWHKELAEWYSPSGLTLDRIRAGRNRKSITKAQRAAYDADIQFVSWALLGEVELKGWDVIIFDEVHKAKNPASINHKAAKELRKRNPNAVILGATGTPVADKPLDIWGQVDLLWPGRFGTQWKFKQRYLEEHEDPWTKSGYRYEGLRADRWPELRDRLRFLMTRTTKQEIAHLIPPWNVESILFELDDFDFFAEAPEGDSLADMKISYVANYVHEVMQQGVDHVFIGCKRLKTADAYGKRNFGSGIQTRVITGTKYPDADKRNEALDEAASLNRCVTIATMDSVGIGINLTTYPVAVVAELDDSLEVMEQFLGRFSRIGGKVPSSVYLMVAEGTQDERQAENIEEKVREKNAVEKPGASAQALESAFVQDNPLEAQRRLGAARESTDFDDLLGHTDDDL